MTETTTTKLEELYNQKELIWDALLGAKHGTPEDKKLCEMYNDVSRKIWIIELAQKDQLDKEAQDNETAPGIS